METESHEDLQHPSVSSNDTHSDDASNHRDAEQKQDVSREEVVQILQVIASTGRFWYDLLQYRLFVLRLLVFVIVRDGVCGVEIAAVSLSQQQITTGIAAILAAPVNSSHLSISTAPYSASWGWLCCMAFWDSLLWPNLMIVDLNMDLYIQRANVVKFLNDRHDWDKLKSMLSFQLKQVLSEYPEARMTSEQQYASFGESYIELVNKLDEELTCFIEGPPFTLQRLCEILLDAKGLYPNLSKLALALEKNLLVTSTLTICTDPYPQATAKELDDQEKPSEKQQQQQQSDSAENGVELLVSDKDEVMTEADVGDDMTIGMEAFEGVKSSETNSELNANSA
ncbi:Serine/threonine-protein phosphatase 4 regulatory subunit 2 [Glycine soja]